MVGLSRSEARARGTRAAFGAQLALALCLSVAAAVLATEAADAWYARVDLSRGGRNTIDPATVERLSNLEDELEVHTFFRGLAGTYAAVGADAIGRVDAFLFLVENALRGDVRVVRHDIGDVGAVQEAQADLGVQGENLVVVRYRSREQAFRVFGEAVSIDWGNPTLDGVRYLHERGIADVVDPRAWDPRPGSFRPARVTGAQTEAVFAAAVARVSSESSPLVCFSTGHGEPSIESTALGSLSGLAGELARDGFELATWDAAEGDVPARAEVLAVIAPRQPLGDAAVARVRAFLERGGRVVAAPAAGAPDALAALLEPYGLRVAEGVVCEPVRDETGGLVEGLEECAKLAIPPAGLAEGNPATDLLRRNGMRLWIDHAAALERLPRAKGADVPIVIDLARSSPDAWRDLRDARGRLDYALDQGAGERVGASTLVALALPGGAARGDGREARLLALGSAGPLLDGDLGFAQNRDFLRAAFNWMADRERRIDVAPRAEDQTVLDPRSREAAVLSWTLWLGLPGAAMLVGVLVGWRRRR